MCAACLVELALLVEEPAPPAADQAVPLIRKLGEFELLERLGQGGMGVVYKARQPRLNRLVALKLIVSRDPARRDFAERFRREAEAAAALDHPGIVTVYEAGEAGGEAYLAMQLIDGLPLEQVIRSTPPTPETAARLTARIARAVHYAHQRGVLHRDLKPGNVLIDTAGEPYLTDFGLARLLAHESTVTSTMASLGTPSYMPPEQAAGGAARATTAGDVYGLGTILFEALTGVPPFSGATAYETVRKVLEQEPRPPSVMNSRIPSDLDTICLKCLSKEPRQRYGSARELADDLERWLRHEPIQARPASGTERLVKWARRRPTSAALVIVSVLAVTVVTVGSVIAAARWREQRDESVAQRLRAEKVSTRLLIEEAERQLREGQPSNALALLAQLLRQSSSNSVAANRIVSLLNQRSFALPLFAGFRHSASLNSAHFTSIPGQVLVGGDSEAQLWEVEGDRRVGAAFTHGAPVVQAQMSPNGLRVVTVGEDRRVRLWDARLANSEVRLDAVQKHARYAEFSADSGRLLVAGDDGRIEIIDGANGRLLRTLQHQRAVPMARFSPDGTRVAGVTTDGLLMVWELHQTPTKPKVRSLAAEGSVVAWDPTGRFLAAPIDGYETLSLVDADTLEKVGGTMRHGAPLARVEFSPDGTHLVTASEDRTARVWDARRGIPLTEPMRHPGVVTGAEFSPDGRQVLTACEDGLARIWDVIDGRIQSRPMNHPAAVAHAGLSADGRKLVTVANDQLVRVWDTRTSTLLFPPLPHPHPLHSAYFNQDGTRIVVADGGRIREQLKVEQGTTVSVWDAVSGKRMGPALELGGRPNGVQLSRDGRRLLTTGQDRVGRLWQVDAAERLLGQYTGAGEPSGAGFSIQFSPDERQMVMAVEYGRAEIWQVEPPVRRHVLPSGKPVRWAEFDPSGRRALTASIDHTARLWDATTGAPVGSPMRHDNLVIGGHFSPDGQRVVTFSSDRTARIWEVPSGKALTVPLRHDDQVWTAFFSPDGTRIVTATWQGAVRVWDAATGLVMTDPLGGGGWRKPYISLPDNARMTPDGQRVLCIFEDNSVRLVEVPRMPEVAPNWLAEVAEAVAGQAVNSERHSSEVPSDQLLQLRKRFSGEQATNSDDPWERWARWFFADRLTRPATAFSD